MKAAVSSSKMMNIRLLQLEDLEALSGHKARHSRENGRDGDFIFMPFEEEFAANDGFYQDQRAALSKSTREPGWQRVWIITDGVEIYGELTLVNRPPLPACLHRCLLMMGMERTVRGQSWGSRLMKEAISWAKAEPGLDWISLYVFENNLPAKALYKKFGFEVVGTTKDRFRVFNQSIDDTEMVLKL